MKEKLYMIGEFAKMNLVSTRMLRHYDKIGLLQPVLILSNGYRYYSHSQFEDIAQIKKLRNCGFSLAEITSIIETNNPAFLQSCAKAKIKELDNQISIHNVSMQHLIELAKEPSIQRLHHIYGISLIKRAHMNLLISKAKCTFENIEEKYDEFYSKIAQNDIQVAGPAVLLDYFKKDEIIIGVGIERAIHTEFFDTIQLPSATILVSINYGDYDQIAFAHREILQYASGFGYQLQDFFMERYFIDRSNNAQPNGYVTELSIAILDVDEGTEDSRL